MKNFIGTTFQIAPDRILDCIVILIVRIFNHLGYYIDFGSPEAPVTCCEPLALEIMRVCSKCSESSAIGYSTCQLFCS